MQMTISNAEMEKIMKACGLNVEDNTRDTNRQAREFIHEAIKEKLANSKNIIYGKWRKK